MLLAYSLLIRVGAPALLAKRAQNRQV